MKKIKIIQLHLQFILLSLLIHAVIKLKTNVLFILVMTQADALGFMATGW